MNRSDTVTTRVITGYEVLRFGVPMIGEYVNTGTGRRVTISPTVPGAQYRITAQALDNGSKRTAAPAVKSATAGEASEFTNALFSHSMLHDFNTQWTCNRRCMCVQYILRELSVVLKQDCSSKPTACFFTLVTQSSMQVHHD